MPSPDVGDVLAFLDLEPAGAGRFVARHIDDGRGIVFGGQLLAQAVVASALTVPDKEVLSLHNVFAQAGHTRRAA